MRNGTLKTQNKQSKKPKHLKWDVPADPFHHQIGADQFFVSYKSGVFYISKNLEEQETVASKRLSRRTNKRQNVSRLKSNPRRETLPPSWGGRRKSAATWTSSSGRRWWRRWRTTAGRRCPSNWAVTTFHLRGNKNRKWHVRMSHDHNISQLERSNHVFTMLHRRKLHRKYWTTSCSFIWNLRNFGDAKLVCSTLGSTPHMESPKSVSKNYD